MTTCSVCGWIAASDPCSICITDIGNATKKTLREWPQVKPQVEEQRICEGCGLIGTPPDRIKKMDLPYWCSEWCWEHNTL